MLFGRLGNEGFSALTLSLVGKFCIPRLLYGVEALNLKTANINSLEFAYGSTFFKLFGCREKISQRYCQWATGYLPASYLIDYRRFIFLKSLCTNKASPFASMLFFLYDDQGIIDLLKKYNLELYNGRVSHLSRGVLLQHMWSTLYQECAVQ